MHIDDDALIELLDGRADPALQSHLLQCAACRDRMAALRTLRERLRQLPNAACNPALWHAIERRLPARATAGHRLARHYRYGPIAALVLAAVLLVLLLDGPGPAGPPDAAIEQAAGSERSIEALDDYAAELKTLLATLDERTTVRSLAVEAALLDIERDVALIDRQIALRGDDDALVAALLESKISLLESMVDIQLHQQLALRT